MKKKMIKGVAVCALTLATFATVNNTQTVMAASNPSMIEYFEGCSEDDFYVVFKESGDVVKNASLYAGASKSVYVNLGNKYSGQNNLAVDSVKAVSSDNSVVNVTLDGADMTIKANKTGTAKITVSAKTRQTVGFDIELSEYLYADYTITETLTVTVKQPTVTVKANTAAHTLYAGKTKKLNYSVSSVGTSNKGVSFSTSNSSIATVSSTGVVTGKKAGTAYITIASKYNKNSKATVKITVKSPTVSISAKKMSLTVNQIEEVNPTVKVAGTSNKKVTYKSSNKKVATVNSDGEVTGKKKGTAYITITSKYNKKFTKKIKVTVKNGSGWDDVLANKAIKAYGRDYTNNLSEIEFSKSAYKKAVAECDKYANGKYSASKLKKQLGKVVDTEHNRVIANGGSKYSAVKITVKGRNIKDINNAIQKKIGSLKGTDFVYVKVYYNKKTNKSTVYVVNADIAANI